MFPRTDIKKNYETFEIICRIIYKFKKILNFALKIKNKQTWRSFQCSNELIWAGMPCVRGANLS